MSSAVRPRVRLRGERWDVLALWPPHAVFNIKTSSIYIRDDCDAAEEAYTHTAQLYFTAAQTDLWGEREREREREQERESQALGRSSRRERSVSAEANRTFSSCGCLATSPRWQRIWRAMDHAEPSPGCLADHHTDGPGCASRGPHGRLGRDDAQDASYQQEAEIGCCAVLCNLTDQKACVQGFAWVSGGGNELCITQVGDRWHETGLSPKGSTCPSVFLEVREAVTWRCGTPCRVPLLDHGQRIGGTSRGPTWGPTPATLAACAQGTGRSYTRTFTRKVFLFPTTELSSPFVTHLPPCGLCTPAIRNEIPGFKGTVTKESADYW
ncbi:unnamed protein product [Lota lota]